MPASHRPSCSAITGPARPQSRAVRHRLGLSGSGLALSALAFAAGGMIATQPALAQLKPDAPTIETPLGRAPITFADIIEKVKPSVVSISVVAGGKKGDDREGGKLPEGFPDIPEDSPFYEFFKNLPKEFRNMPQQRPTQAQGSGFVISADGFVVTNNHVVENASKIQVSFDDQEKLEADLIGTDPRTDLALLKIKSAKSFPSVKFAAKPARVGDWVIAVGNPFGLGGTVTAGIVSAQGRDIGSGPYDFLQIDAAVNKGNSGGPTFDLNGDVIGVNTAIFSPSGGNVGIAFAVPARTAMDVIEQLKKDGSVSRGWLGVKIQNVDEDTASAVGLTEAKGALVSEVTADGPAATSGLKVQDSILSVNGERIADSRDLARKIAGYAPNTVVDVKVWRDNKEETVKVTLGKFPGSSEEIAKLERGGKPSSTEPDPGMELDQLGLTLSPKAAKDGGVTISEVDQESDAAEKGVKAGDVIVGVGDQQVANPGDVVDGIKKAKELGRKAVMLRLKSADQTRIVPLQLKKS